MRPLLIQTSHTRPTLSLVSPAIATWSGTFSFFMPGILGILGIAGMLVNQLAVVEELCGAGAFSA